MRRAARPTPQTATPSDEALAARAADGDEQALVELVGRWQDAIVRLAYRLTGDRETARDVRQMTLQRLLRSIASFEGRARFSTWLHRIVVNLCRDVQRGRRDEPLLATDAALQGPAGIEERLEPCPDGAPETARSIARQVLALPAREREVVVLRHYHDLSFPAIAEILGAPETTVKSRLARGLERLRERLLDLQP